MIFTALAYYGGCFSRVVIVIGSNSRCAIYLYYGHPSSKGGITNLEATGPDADKPEVPREKRAEDVSFAISSLMQDIAPHQ